MGRPKLVMGDSLHHPYPRDRREERSMAVLCLEPQAEAMFAAHNSRLGRVGWRVVEPGETGIVSGLCLFC